MNAAGLGAAFAIKPIASARLVLGNMLIVFIVCLSAPLEAFTVEVERGIL